MVYGARYTVQGIRYRKTLGSNPPPNTFDLIPYTFHTVYGLTLYLEPYTFYLNAVNLSRCYFSNVLFGVEIAIGIGIENIGTAMFFDFDSDPDSDFDWFSQHEIPLS